MPLFLLAPALLLSGLPDLAIGTPVHDAVLHVGGLESGGGSGGGGSGGGGGGSGGGGFGGGDRSSGGERVMDRFPEPRSSGGSSSGGGDTGRVRDTRTQSSGGSGKTEQSGSGDRQSSGGSGSSGSGTSGSGISGSGSSGSGSSGSGSSGSSGSGSSGSGSSDSSGSGSSGSGSGHSSESVESLDEMRSLAASQSPDFDSKGFPARRGEVLGVDMDARQMARARSLGFEVASDVHLKALDMRMVRLRAPKGMAASEAVTTLREGEGDATYDFDHFYGVNGYQDGKARTRAAPPPKGNLWVGMIDTGVGRHTALSGVQVQSRNFSANRQQATMPRKHGTAVASILARQGAGRITSANIFTADGKPFAAANTIASALDWLVQQGAPVINISLAGPGNVMLDRVVSRAIAKGFVIVAAAGNGGPAAAPAFPAAIPGVVAATAVDSTGHIYRYANQGQYVFIAAPGVGVSAASDDGNMASFSGTSFAAPVVAARLAGCAPRLDSVRARQCIAQIGHSAIDLGAPGRDPVYGFGMITGH
jgi:hypothetical protein